MHNSQEDFENFQQELVTLKNKIKRNNSSKIIRNYSYSVDFENKGKMTRYPKNEDKPNLDIRTEENHRKANTTKISNKKLLSNIHKKIKDAYKRSNEFESESEINYYEDYEVK